MDPTNLLRLLLLSAIWGSSFLFMKIAAPVLGSATLSLGRLGFGALFLLALMVYWGKRIDWPRHWKHFVVLGAFSAALPSWLYGEASHVLTTAQLSVLNATAPTWGYVIGLGLRQETWMPRRGLGLLVGMVGLTVLVKPSVIGVDGRQLMAMLMCLLATFCYGVATNYAKRSVALEPFVSATGALAAGAVLLIPAAVVWPMTQAPTLNAVLSVLAVGVLCSGLAYWLYFRLIQDVGPTSALLVTYLIPVFGSLWGGVFLGEWPSLQTLYGMCIILVGTALVIAPKRPKPTV